MKLKLNMKQGTGMKKEKEDEYKYFPEPDIPRIVLGKDFKNNIKEKIPELPIDRLKRYKNVHNLSDHVCKILINNKRVSDFYEESLKLYNSPKEISNWIINELLSKVQNDEGKENIATEIFFVNSGFRENKFFNLDVSPHQIADIAKLVEESSINRNTAKDIFNKSIKTGESPLKLIKIIKAEKISDEQELIKNINEVLYAEPNLIEQSTNNPNIYNFILGKIIKKTNGRADPQLTIKLIKKEMEDKK